MTKYVKNSDVYITWIDNIRATACMLVVLLHVAAGSILNPELVDETSWTIAILIDSFTRVSVPLFFMIAGFLFMRKKQPSGRHFIRLIISLIFYSLIAISLITIKNGLDTGFQTLTNIMTKPAFYHLWFLYPIICIYLLAGMIQIRKDNLCRNLVYLLIFMIILNPRMANLIGTDHYMPTFKITGGFLYYVLFAIAGAIIGEIAENEKFVKNKWWRRGLIYDVIFVAAGLITFILTMKSSIDAGKYIGIFFQYDSPLVIIASLVLFYRMTLHINNKIKTEKSPKPSMGLIRFIADNSLAIYGIHAFVLYFITEVSLRFWGPGIIEIPAVFLIVMTISAGGAVFLRKIDKKRLFT